MRTIVLVEGTTDKLALTLAARRSGRDLEAEGVSVVPLNGVHAIGYTYRSSIAPMGGRNLISLSSKNREAAGVKGGESLELEISLDTEPRIVSVPDDLAAALAADPVARATFERLSYSNKSWHVLQLEDARTPETRSKRLAKSIDALRSGLPR